MTTTISNVVSLDERRARRGPNRTAQRYQDIKDRIAERKERGAYDGEAIAWAIGVFGRGAMLELLDEHRQHRPALVREAGHSDPGSDREGACIVLAAYSPATLRAVAARMDACVRSPTQLAA